MRAPTGKAFDRSIVEGPIRKAVWTLAWPTMLQNITPAVEHFTAYDGEKTSGNDEFVHMVAEQNIRLTIDDIRRNSSLLKEMEGNGEIRIVGGLYDMDTGQVSFLE